MRQDGEISPRERGWLEKRLAADPEARQEAQRIETLSAMLEQLPEREPPPELPARIDSALAESAVRYPVQEDDVGLFSSILAVGWVPRLAYLAAGLVLGAFLYHAAHDRDGAWSSRDMEGVYGTILEPAGETEEVHILSLADEAGRLALRRSDSTLLVELTLRDSRAVDLTVGGGGAVSLVALRHASASSPDIEHRDGSLRIGGLSDGLFLFSARVADPTNRLHIEVSSVAGSLGRARINLAELPASSNVDTNFPGRSE